MTFAHVPPTTLEQLTLAGGDGALAEGGTAGSMERLCRVYLRSVAHLLHFHLARKVVGSTLHEEPLKPPVASHNRKKV
eukprot:SAG11_NODE_1543_length_4716_cov_6.357375_7_plen_78_part_00